MSTNFYLIRDAKPCVECGHPRRDGSLHIGKRSGGWVFTWQGFDADEAPNGNPLYGAESWRDFLTCEVAEGAEIRDEYRQAYTLAEFFAVVEEQRGQQRQSAFYPEHKKAIGPDDVSYGNWS